MATEVTHTVGVAPTRGYTSLSAWEAAQQRNLVTADEIEIAQCYNDGLMTDRVGILGWTTDSTRYIKIVTPTSERHTGVSGTGFTMRNTASLHAMNIRVPNVRVEGLEIYSTVSTQDNIVINHTLAGWMQICYNLLPQGRYGIALSDGASASLSVEVWNNFIYGSQIGIAVNDADAPSYLYSNSILGCTTAGIFIPATNAVVTKDCACLGNTLDFAYSSRFGGSSDYNASTALDLDTDRAPGINSVLAALPADNWENITAGTENLHVKNSDADIFETGTNLSADPNLSFSDDIDGDSRPSSGPWDIGGDESQIVVTTGTFNLDGLLGDRLTGPFILDALIGDRLTGPFILDALIGDRLTGTFLLDALIGDRLTGTFLLDALIGDRLTESFALDVNIIAPGLLPPPSNVSRRARLLTE